MGHQCDPFIKPRTSGRHTVHSAAMHIRGAQTTAQALFAHRFLASADGQSCTIHPRGAAPECPLFLRARGSFPVPRHNLWKKLYCLQIFKEKQLFQTCVLKLKALTWEGCFPTLVNWAVFISLPKVPARAERGWETGKEPSFPACKVLQDTGAAGHHPPASWTWKNILNALTPFHLTSPDTVDHAGS